MSNINLGVSQSKGYENVDIKTISSREVATMMEIKHWEVLRKLDGTDKTKGIIPILTDNKIVVSDYFIQSEYKDASGKVNKEYLCTKLGCDFLANKFSGEKGILFTARYVKRFEQMEQALHNPYANLSPELQMLIKLEQGQTVLTQRVEEQKQDIVGVKQDVQKFKEEMPIFTSQRKEISKQVRALGVKLLGGKKSPAYQDKSLRAQVYSDINGQIHREFGVESCDDIKRRDYSAVFSIIHNYSLPTHLVNTIDYTNSQMTLGV